jgi:hypothetical protein
MSRVRRHYGRHGKCLDGHCISYAFLSHLLVFSVLQSISYRPNGLYGRLSLASKARRLPQGHQPQNGRNGLSHWSRGVPSAALSGPLTHVNIPRLLQNSIVVRYKRQAGESEGTLGYVPLILLSLLCENVMLTAIDIIVLKSYE